MSVGLLLRAKLQRTFFSKFAGHQKPDQLLKKMERWIGHEAENYVAWAEINKKTDQDKEWFSLTSSNIGLGNRAVCTIVFTNPEDRDWAIGVWKSLQPPQAPSAQ